MKLAVGERNLSGTGNPFVEGGADPGNYATFSGDVGTVGIGSPYYRTQVGEWENFDSPYGTFDQGGNVWEWNETSFYDVYRGMRGGSFHVDYYYLQPLFCVTNPSSESYGDGFRVAEVPEPSTVGLLGLGMLAVLRKRRK